MEFQFDRIDLIVFSNDPVTTVSDQPVVDKFQQFCGRSEVRFSAVRSFTNINGKKIENKKEREKEKQKKEINK